MLVERQPLGAQVDGIPHLPRQRLVIQALAFGVTLQVDVDLSPGNHGSRLRVILKVVAVDLVEAVRLAPVHDDVHVVQLGMPALFELGCLGSSNREQGAPAFTLGKRESFARLLNLNAEFSRKILERAAHLVARPQVKTRHHRDSGQGHHGKPDSQARDRYRHDLTSVREPPSTRTIPLL